jgi:hypothetical protein
MNRNDAPVRYGPIRALAITYTGFQFRLRVKQFPCIAGNCTFMFSL